MAFIYCAFITAGNAFIAIETFISFVQWNARFLHRAQSNRVWKINSRNKDSHIEFVN